MTYVSALTTDNSTADGVHYKYIPFPSISTHTTPRTYTWLCVQYKATKWSHVVDTLIPLSGTDTNTLWITHFLVLDLHANRRYAYYMYSVNSTLQGSPSLATAGSPFGIQKCCQVFESVHLYKLHT